MLQVQQLHGFGVLGESTGNDQFTKVLLHFDGTDGSTTFTDVNKGGSAHTWTVNGNVQLDTAQSKFGGASLLCDGSGDYTASLDHADFQPAGDYTIDCWIRANGLTGDRCVFSKPNTGANQYFAAYTVRWESAAGALRFYSSSNGTSHNIANAKNLGAISTGIWYHIAVVRSGNTYYLFKDGVQQDTFTSSLTPHDSTAALYVGRFSDTNDWNGWIDEFRLSNGIARWTSQFTPPQNPYW